MSEQKKKLPLFVKIILIILLVIVLAVSALVVYSKLDKKQSLTFFPHDYSVYVHTDSAWKAVEPLLDLKAVDIFLSTPELAKIRGAFMQLRASEWRSNKVLAKLASRPIDAAFYKEDNEEKTTYHFLASVDLGGLSSVTRFSSVYLSKLGIENLYESDGYFVYDNKGSEFYIKPYKNFIIISDNQPILERAFEQDYNNYTKEELEVINRKNSDSIKIIANIRNLLSGEFEKEGVLHEISKVIPENGLCSLSFSLTDESIKLNANIPVVECEEEGYTLNSVFQKKSTTPSILSRFRENVQYYTIINAGSLEELKDSFFPIFVKNPDETWGKFDSVSKMVLNVTLEDLLFSWTGTEIAAFGIEGKNNPVFALQIKDEKKRQEVFEKFLSSMLIKDNSSLLLDGVRIPRIELPSFIQGLLDLFNVSLPNPYYLIQDGFIYFSESAENLSELYKSQTRIEKISGDPNWNTVSKNLSSDTTLSLYYNLERSVPFFLKSKANISNLLALYSIGRCDFNIKKSELVLQISAISTGKEKSNVIPGFPIELEGKVDGKLYLEDTNKKAQTNALYWVENEKNICKMELPSTEIKRNEMSDKVFVSPYVNKSKGDEKLWAVTAHGEVYLYTQKMEAVEGFPMFIGENIYLQPYACEDGLYVFADSGKTYLFNKDGNAKTFDLNLSGVLKSSPTVYEDKIGRRFIGFYDKSFLGKIVVICDYGNEERYSLDVAGISYGSPVFYSNSKADLPIVSFITQNGDFYLWNLGTDENEIYHVDGIYRTNPVCVGDSFVVLSTDGVLTKITMDGDMVSVQIPNATCNEPFISVNDDIMYVCPDGNIIYGFDKNLELAYPFPITGWGIPAFADVNGDKTPDCFALSVDNKIQAIKMR